MSNVATVNLDAKNVEREGGLFCCDLCGKFQAKQSRFDTRRLMISETRFQVIRCKACGLKCLWPQPTADEFKMIYADYGVERNRAEIEQKRISKVYKSRLSQIKQKAPGNRILDIGAGLGTFLSEATSMGFEVVGVEFDSGQCEYARATHGLEVINGDIEEVWSSLGQFDAINVHHVMEHVLSPSRLLRIVHSLLRPGGIAVVEVPNQFYRLHREIWYRLRGNAPCPDNSLHHLYFFSRRTFLEYFKRQSFEILAFNQWRNADLKRGGFKSSLKRVSNNMNLTLGGFLEATVRRV